MTEPQAKEWILRILASLVLAAFVWLYGVDLWGEIKGESSLMWGGPEPTAAQEIENPRLYLTTAVGALVGGVAAVFLGVEKPTLRSGGESWSASEWIRLVYVVIYVLFGSAAIVAWVSADEVSLALRNLAVTFIGLVTPAVAAYLAANPGRENKSR